ncbi:MAG: hypothetical protein J6Y02_24100 [Pseudobutyrivibrio sp.]|nr:hypothetical protein [Pseudobutyrivibrio sp.]
MANKRIPRKITSKEEIDYFLNLDSDRVCDTSFMMETFGVFEGKSKFHPYDIIDIPPGSYGPKGKKNKNTFTTTVGRWVFNKAFIEPHFFDLFGYINKPITSKMIKWINQQQSYALLEDKITMDDMMDYNQRCQKFQGYTTMLCPSISEAMLLISKTIEPKKKELLKKYAKEIATNDAYTVGLIENELLDEAKKALKDDPTMDLYDSGAVGSFDNNFKNMYIMKGAVKDPDPLKGYNIITSNQIDGITKEEYSKYANALPAGPYARAKKTEVFGYYEKLFLNAFQHVVLDKPGSDCGTKRTITVTLTDKMLDQMMYSYIVEGSRLVELTAENRDKYRGKTVKMRFSSLCEGTQICNKCAGNLFYRLGIRNIGVATPQLASKVKVITMKGFHDSTVKYGKVDIKKAFGV